MDWTLQDVMEDRRRTAMLMLKGRMIMMMMMKGCVTIMIVGKLNHLQQLKLVKR